MPEYFNEMNERTNDASGAKKNKPPDVKEVWFAGSHSDVWVRLCDPLLCTDILRTGVERTDLEHLIRLGTSPCCGCVEKRLHAGLC